MTLGELCFVCNENNYDVDVYDDYDNRIACCYCGDEDFSLTEEGLKEFGDALGLIVDWSEGRSSAIVNIPENDDSERLVELARRFIHSCAGYCSDSNYRKWFLVEG